MLKATGKVKKPSVKPRLLSTKSKRLPPLISEITGKNQKSLR